MKDDIAKIIDFQKKRNWKQFHSLKNLAISLNLEASELLELFQWTKDNNLPKEYQAGLEEEIADVYYYLLLLSHEAGIDIRKAFKNKMKINENKYPIEKAKNNSIKYNKRK